MKPTGSETDERITRLVPETIADFRAQELIGNNTTANRAENAVAKGIFRQNSDIEINVPHIPIIN